MKSKIKLNLAQLELELGLRLANMLLTRSISMVSKPFVFEVFVVKSAQ